MKKKRNISSRGATTTRTRQTSNLPRVRRWVALTQITSKSSTPSTGATRVPITGRKFLTRSFGSDLHATFSWQNEKENRGGTRFWIGPPPLSTQRPATCRARKNKPHHSRRRKRSSR